MLNETMRFTPPKWTATRWLTHVGTTVPGEIRHALVSSLFGTLPIFAGGVLNTVAIAFLIAWRHMTPAFLFWAIAETLICAVRLTILVISLNNARRGRSTPTDAYIVLGVLWAASTGYGAFITIGTGDWVASTLACLSSAAMTGGICFRNFAAPRMTAAMIGLTLGPVVIAAVASGEAILRIVAAQIPLYMFAMTAAAYRLNKLLIATMQAERDNDHRATHDVLTGIANRAGLERAFEQRSLAHAGRAQAVLYLDLDDFKLVNDRHGHAAGDELLIGVANRLRDLRDPDDVVARIGGDEFVMLRWSHDAQDTQRFAETVAKRLTATPYPVGTTVAAIGASVGVAIGTGGDLKLLLAAADGALYRAKDEGGGCRFSDLPYRGLLSAA